MPTSLSAVQSRHTPKLIEALKLCEGVEGKNEPQRDAKLRLEPEAEYTALTEAEDALTETRCAYKVARLEWELVRCQVRALEPRTLVEAA